MKNSYLQKITSLRFFAAFYVVGYHYYSFPGEDVLNRFFSRGYVGVPFFFLLSGFILTYRHLGNEFSKKKE